VALAPRRRTLTSQRHRTPRIGPPTAFRCRSRPAECAYQEQQPDKQRPTRRCEATFTRHNLSWWWYSDFGWVEADVRGSAETVTVAAETGVPVSISASGMYYLGGMSRNVPFDVDVNCTFTVDAAGVVTVQTIL
jgi:hypothetical protein